MNIISYNVLNIAHVHLFSSMQIFQVAIPLQYDFKKYFLALLIDHGMDITS